MQRRPRGESLSARLRSEVQVSASLWKIGTSADKNPAVLETKPRLISRPSTGAASSGNTEDGYPCPREVKPLIFFYKYLQPIGAAETIGAGGGDSNSSTSSSSQRKLRLNLPLTMVCERANGQEIVLWLRTDTNGNVVREEKTVLWRKRLNNDLTSSPFSPESHGPESEQVLAVRSVARWKSSSNSSGGSAVVLTRKTIDPILAVPCELPICVQQFVHCRGTQASVYRVFWCEQERKCYAVNLTNSLRNNEAAENNNDDVGAPITTPSMNGIQSGNIAAVNAAFEAAMIPAAQLAKFYCVTISPDARSCARWPKLRGAAISEGIQAISRLVEHLQLQLPTLRFRSMTVDFIKDTTGTWWLTRVIDFQASSCVEPLRDGDGGFGSRDSAVLIPEFLRSKDGRSTQQPLESESPVRESAPMQVEEPNNSMNARICFLCSSACVLSPTFQSELVDMLKGHSEDEYREQNTITMAIPVAEEFRMTLTMALDTIFAMRQRGIVFPLWETAVQTVRKAHLRDVCDFQVCLLCYRIYQQHQRLQRISRELHSVWSPGVSSGLERPEQDNEQANKVDVNKGIGMAASAASDLAVSKLLSTPLRVKLQLPNRILAPIEAFRNEAIPSQLLRSGHTPDIRSTRNALAPLRGAEIDPIATQLRLVFFFHELQDAGPQLVPTDFFLEYQIGQDVTRVHLEGSKRHTPNRWQLCEARVHYLFATPEAFSEFCSQKHLLIKMKAKSGSPIRKRGGDSTQVNVDDVRDVHSNSSSEEDDMTDRTTKHRGRKRRRKPNEFFGYSMLSLKPLFTAAKGFGNSLQLECRTDYLLELQTVSYGLLTLKLTIGLLVDPVPLGNVRDVLRDQIFLEEQPPRGIYWPPPTYCLTGLAVPRDWVGALMPSEYTKVLPMNSRKAHNAHHAGLNSQQGSQRSRSLVRRDSSNFMEANSELSIPRPQARRLSVTGKSRAQSIRVLEAFNSNNQESPSKQDEEEDEEIGHACVERNPELMSFANVAMAGTTLTRTCSAARRIVFRITDDKSTNRFPTALLAAILRYASFCNTTPASTKTWKSPSTFRFSRRYSMDRLLAEVKLATLPMLALMGELLFVLLQDNVVPSSINAGELESLLEPHWRQDSGWRAISRSQSNCLPDHRVIWNRAIRRWSGADLNDDSVQHLTCSDQQDATETSRKLPVKCHAEAFAADVGDFRSKSFHFVLCELFEQMETLDSGYIEIAELRSLAKCLPGEAKESPSLLDPEIGTHEQLSQEDVEALVELVSQQRSRAIRAILCSLLESSVMTEALSRFDRIGYGEMSLEEFRELACGAMLSQRKIFRAFDEEPKKSYVSFCLRHGFVAFYGSDGVCVCCTAEYRKEKPAKTPTATPPISAVSADASAEVGPSRVAADDPPTTSDERMLLEQSLELPKDSRRSTSPSVLVKPSSAPSLKDQVERVLLENGRRSGILGVSDSRQMLESALDCMLDRLQTAERTIVSGDTPGADRRPSSAGGRSRKASTAGGLNGMRTSASCVELDMGTAARKRIPSSASTTAIERINEAGPEVVTVTKKKTKRKTSRKAARRSRASEAFPTSASLSHLLRMEFSDQKRKLTTSASEDIIGRAVRVEEKRKQLDRLVLAEVQEVKKRLAKLLDEE